MPKNVSPSRTRAVLLSAALVGTGLAGCGGSTTSGSADGRIPVVASTNVWGAVAAAVGGDAVDVRSIIDDPAKDPHDYESTPQDLVTIGEAKLVVSNGGGYDDFFAKAVHAGPANLQSVEAFQLSGKAATSEVNPHVFYDLPTVKKVADQIGADLGRIDPAQRDRFAANARAFDAKADDALAAARQIGVSHPGSKVVVTEPVADYLLQAAAVTDITPTAFSDAVQKDTDIPVAAAQQMEQLIAGKQANALIDNTQTENQTTRSLESRAGAAGLPVVGVTETLPPGQTSYLAWIGKEIDALSKALATS